MNTSDISASDAVFNVALIMLPLAALVFGVGMGIVLTKLGYFIVFREHLDKHFFSSTPDRECPFCREERGIRQDTGGTAGRA